MSKEIKFLVIIVAIAALLFFALAMCNSRAKEKSDNEAKDNMYQTISQDSLKKINDSTVQSQVMEATSKAFLEVISKEKQIKDLQELVRSYKSKLEAGSSVTTMTTGTHFTDKGKTVIKETPYTEYQSVYSVKDTTNKAVFPTKQLDTALVQYTRDYQDEWVQYSVVADRDSILLTLETTDKYSTIIGYNKGKPFADIISSSPYSKVKTNRTFQVSMPPPKKWGIGASTGVTYYGNHFAPYIGLGVNYNFIRF